MQDDTNKDNLVHKPFILLKKFIRQHPYVWVCYAMIVGVMGTALASPLYPIYQEA